MRSILFSFTFLLAVISSPDILSQSGHVDYTNDNSVIATVGDIKITVDEFINGYEFGPAFYKRIKDSKKVLFLVSLLNLKK